jgi:predicted nucleic acid-binding protein
MSRRPSAAPREAPRVVINDASCLFDLYKGGILRAMLALPYSFRVALPVRRNEVLTISQPEWAILEAAGLATVDLPGDAVAEAIALKVVHAALSAEDCFSFVLARRTSEAALLTGDGTLRRIAAAAGIDVHGVLWIVDELLRLKLYPEPALHTCLRAWRDDPLVWLPDTEITSRLDAIQGATRDLHES